MIQNARSGVEIRAPTNCLQVELLIKVDASSYLLFKQVLCVGVTTTFKAGLKSTMIGDESRVVTTMVMIA